MNIKIFIGFSLLFANVPSPIQANKISAQLQELAKLRAEVDGLSHSLSQIRTQTQDASRAAAAQISHLELQFRQAKIRNATLRKERKRALERIAKQEDQRNALTKPLTATLDVLRQHVKRGLPYQSQRRLGALAQIEKELLVQTPNPASAFAKILQFVDDEETLTREIALGQQVISIGGGEVLVDVLHVGMAALYFATKDNRYGAAMFAQEGYSFQLFDSAKDSQAVSALFEAVRKGQRTGFVQIPLQFSNKAGL